METKHSRIYPLAVIGMLFIFTLNCEKDDRVEISFAGGIGTQADPYLIETPEQLYSVRYNPDKHFKQVADLDLGVYGSDAGWLPIGNLKNPFAGTFDGNGYKITNLTIKSPEINYVGLFGYTGRPKIKNVVLEIVKISGGKYSFGSHVAVGGLVGNNTGNIANSYAAGSVSGNKDTGGLVGWNIEANIEYSFYDKETTEQEDTGKGIPKTTVEMMQQSTIENWDFTSIWRINEGSSYPYLRWQE